MRKIISFFSPAVGIIQLVSALAMLSSCRNDPAPVIGTGVADEVGIVKSIDIDVPQTAWQYSDMADNNYFYATVKVPELNNTIFKKGMVKMYRYFDFGSTQMEMPYVKLAEEFINGERYCYTEAVDYEYSVNTITIYFTASDFIYEDDLQFVPESMQFRCVLLY